MFSFYHKIEKLSIKGILGTTSLILVLEERVFIVFFSDIKKKRASGTICIVSEPFKS